MPKTERPRKSVTEDARLTSAPSGAAAAQHVEQHTFWRTRCRHQRVVDVTFPQTHPHVIEKLLKLVEIGFAHVARIDKSRSLRRQPRLDFFKPRQVRPRQLQFVGIERLQDNDIVFWARRLHSLARKSTDCLRRYSAYSSTSSSGGAGNRSDSTTMIDRRRTVSDSSSSASELGATLRRRVFQCAAQVPRCAARAAGYTAAPRPGDEQPGGIVLTQKQIRQRRREQLGKVELGQPILPSVAHRSGRIDDDIGADFGFFLEALDVVFVHPSDGTPVDVAQLVAGGILFVLGKLDGRAVVRRPMQTLQSAVRNRPCPQSRL